MVTSIIKQIGCIGNFYGELFVKLEDFRCFWGIEDHNEMVRWEEIPRSLYDELLKFEKSSNSLPF